MANDSNPSDPFPGDERTDQPTSHEIRHSQASALVPEHIATGVYSTGAMVFQGAHEFVLDFMMRLGKPHQLVARIILAPTVIPSILRALQSNLDSYEKQFHPEKQQTKRTETTVPPTSVEDPKEAVKEVEENKAEEPQIEEQNPEEPKEVFEQQITSPGPGSSESIVNPNPGAKVQPTPDPEEQTHQIEDLYSELKIAPEVMSGTYANAVLIGHSANEISFDFITTFFPRSSVACRIHMAIPTARRLHDSLAQAHKQYLRRHQKPVQPPPSPKVRPEDPPPEATE
ncbi:MAG: DUF3467 domain-containing protein [Planctomycetaceae bacterium]|nr:DUF3467 domain-containing protein [Planctomycetaceae bacterium]